MATKTIYCGVMIPPTGVRAGYFFSTEPPAGAVGRAALPFHAGLAQEGQVSGGIDASQR